MRDTNLLTDRLAELLKKLRVEKGYSWSALEGYIRQANGGKGAATVDRRKLARLHAGDDTVTLSIKELRALHIYFYKRGYIGLTESMLFSLPESLLDAFHGETKLTMFYPARYLEAVGTEAASHWDLRAVAELLGTPEIAGLATSLQDVFHFGEHCTEPGPLKSKLKKERWYRKLADEGAVLSLGSPFVSYSTEEILCRMFDQDEFRPKGYSKENPLPFYLYWPDAVKTTESAFSITRKELDKHYRETAAKLGENDRALLIDGELHIAESNGKSLNLVAAQYWKGHLVLVLIGIFAPATFAIAQCIANRLIEQALPAYSEGGSDTRLRKRVLIALIETLIEQDDPTTWREGRDHRELRSNATKVLASQLWECKDNRWSPC